MATLVGKRVGLTGYGLMGLTWRSQPPSDEQAFKAMRASLATGCNFWVGGEFYGPPGANSLNLLQRYYQKYPEDAEKVVLSIKGAVRNFRPDGTPKVVTQSVEQSLKDLGDKGKIDIFECARVDKNTPLEVTLVVLDRFVKAGKIGGIGLSEVGADTIRAAVKITRIAAVEVEVSLWATDIFRNGVAATCAELGIPIIAYSPIGRGILTGQILSPEDIPEGDSRKHDPRYQPKTFKINIQLVDALKKVAKEKGCTPAQLAISWVRSQSKRNGNPEIIPIPGATTEERVLENAINVSLTEKELADIDAILSNFETSGARYGGPAAAYMDG